MRPYLKYQSPFRFIFLFFILLISLSANAQVPADFSGKWVFDISKSNAGAGGSFLYPDIMYTIKQDTAVITVDEVIHRQGSEDVSNTEIFRLDGNESVEKKDYGTLKRSVQWSSDKKAITFISVITVSPNDYRNDATYSLSDEGKTLTIRNEFKNPDGNSTVIQVFHKAP